MNKPKKVGTRVGFKWRPGFPTRKVDVTAVGNIFLELREKFKDIPPEELVKEAKKKKNAAILSPFFTFSVKKAAHLHNISEAQALIRAVDMDYQVEEVIYTVRAFHHVQTEEEGRGYRYLPDILDSALGTAELITDARNDLRAWHKKYQTLAVLAESVEHVRLALVTMPKTKKRKTRK